MAAPSCHASLGMFDTASPYAGYRRQRSDEMVRKRGRAPTPICPCRTADASTRIWPSFSNRTSLISRQASTRFPPIMVALRKRPDALNFCDLTAMMNRRVVARFLQMPLVVNWRRYDLARISDRANEPHITNRDTLLAVCQLFDVV